MQPTLQPGFTTTRPLITSTVTRCNEWYVYPASCRQWHQITTAKLTCSAAVQPHLHSCPCSHAVPLEQPCRAGCPVFHVGHPVLLRDPLRPRQQCHSFWQRPALWHPIRLPLWLSVRSALHRRCLSRCGRCRHGSRQRLQLGRLPPVKPAGLAANSGVRALLI